MAMRTKRTSLLALMIALVLMLPMGALLADSLEMDPPEGEDPPVLTEGPGQEEGQEEEQEEQEDPEDSEDPEGGLPEELPESASDQARKAHDQIRAARDLGIPPGHLRQMDKLAEWTGKTRDEILAAYGELPHQDLMKALREARKPAGDETADAGDESEGATANGKGKALGRKKNGGAG